MRKKEHLILPGLLLSAVCLSGLSSAHAAIFSLTAIAGNTGVDIGIDGVFDNLLGGSFSTAVQAARNVPPNSSGEERRGVLEYALAGLSGTVFSASVNPGILNFSTPAPDVEVYVYSGDGSILLNDMTVAGILVFQDQVSSTPLAPIDVTDALQALIGGGATHLGVRIHVTGEPNFMTWGNGQSGVYSTLEITTIPLPPALWLLGSGLLGLTAITRRRR